MGTVSRYYADVGMWRYRCRSRSWWIRTEIDAYACASVGLYLYRAGGLLAGFQGQAQNKQIHHQCHRYI